MTAPGAVMARRGGRWRAMRLRVCVRWAGRRALARLITDLAGNFGRA